MSTIPIYFSCRLWRNCLADLYLNWKCWCWLDHSPRLVWNWIYTSGKQRPSLSKLMTRRRSVLKTAYLLHPVGSWRWWYHSTRVTPAKQHDFQPCVICFICFQIGHFHLCTTRYCSLFCHFSDRHVKWSAYIILILGKVFGDHLHKRRCFRICRGIVYCVHWYGLPTCLIVYCWKRKSN
jgi:hypothetical protein